MTKCETCGFELYTVIGATLVVSTLALYDDHRFPGRCILSLNPHYSDFQDVPEAIAQAFLADMRMAAHAIKKATQADRINYAILMNAEAHVHAHLIPRTYANDPVPRQAPWAHPEKATKLPPLTRHQLVQRISEVLKVP